MQVNICGVPHRIIEKEDHFTDDTYMGQIEYITATILINKKAVQPELKNNIIIHEMVHGMFTHIGRNDLADDEALVQSLANAISQGFIINYINEDD